MYLCICYHNAYKSPPIAQVWPIQCKCLCSQLFAAMLERACWIVKLLAVYLVGLAAPNWLSN